MKIFTLIQPHSAKSFLEDYLLRRTEVSDAHDMSSLIIAETIHQVPSYIQPGHLIRELKTEGLILFDSRCHFSEEVLLNLLVEGECIMMEFSLLEHPNQTNLTEPTAKANGCHNLLYFKELLYEKRLPKNSSSDIFCVLMSETYFKQLVGQSGHDDLLFAKQVAAGIATSLAPTYLPMNFEMHQVISKVRNCSRTGNFHRLCLEIKLLELLMLQFEQYHQSDVKQERKPSLHEDDERKIRLAQQILEESFQEPPTIGQLARRVGVNEFKLKKEFKALFQCTIHDFIVQYRMEKANQLIKQQQLQIREVAMELGYKNPSHFSAAFKKHYGYLPTELHSMGK